MTSPKESTPDRIAVSRHELLRLVVDWSREVERADDPQTPVSPRREALLRAVAKARVLNHERPWTSPLAVLPFWSGPGSLPTQAQMESCAREAKAAIPRLEGLDSQLAPWTGGFWEGLRAAGALVVHGGYPRILPGRPWLAEDLERVPFPGRLSPPDRQGRRWLSRCQAWRVPAADPLGTDVLAGLLAGARRFSGEDGVWLRLPRTAAVTRLLQWWGLSVMRLPDDGGSLHVSPFYAALLCTRMPAASAAAVRSIRKAGDCPLLPLAVWEVVWGAGGPPAYLLPDRAGALPWACGDATRKRRGWTREYLHRAAVALGVAHVTVEMRGLLKEWRKAHRRTWD